MARKMNTGESYSFDVVVEQTIGTVDVNEYGTEPPTVAAMRLIALNDTEGVYSFPMPDGRRTKVTVEWVGTSDFSQEVEHAPYD